MQSHPLVAAVLARYGNAVATRMVARLAELALVVGRLADSVADHDGERWVDAFPLGDHEGLGVVQTARGLLLHRAQVAEDRVTGYQIVAPTEWNFHPDGALVRGFEGVEATDEAELARDARLAVQALDPCVACRVEVAHA
jgi:coenzyme F420-reducing hydrogenase alpha subunit